MERNLEKALEDITHQPGVIGALCADRQGLCLSAKGQVSPDLSGVTATMTELASKLIDAPPPANGGGDDPVAAAGAALSADSSKKSPIIMLEGETSLCLIQRQDDVVLTLAKTTQGSS